VPGVGQQRERAGSPPTGGFDSHAAGRQAQREREPAVVRGVTRSGACRAGRPFDRAMPAGWSRLVS
jgi:hypothetical protein